MKKVVVIGSGFAGLASACSLAQKGHEVHLFEKNSTTGGRARAFKAEGFMFDMGPSWYWMPEVFESFFNRFGKSTSDYYQLERLNPSYRVFFPDKKLDIPADKTGLKAMLDGLEPGAGDKLEQFLAEAKIKYDTGMGRFVWKPSLSVLEFAEFSLIKESFRLQLFSNMKDHLRQYFSHPQILQLLEFPVLFLGAKPSKTPALYSMMNYADIELGTWYPMGGMCKIAEGMTSMAKELGVHVHTSAPVDRILSKGKTVHAVVVNGKEISCDAVIGAGDYHHIESKLLTTEQQSYSADYWEKRVMSPSSLLFYVGVNRKVSGLLHHNLFFDESFDRHAEEIYDRPQWPNKPLFYVCCPSKTDDQVAPEGQENLFILIPVAPGLTSSEDERKKYFHEILSRIKEHTGEDISNDIVYYQSFAHEEFEKEYHSFKGNAYGLANTLMQTAFLKPRLKSKKLTNLYFAGQLTVPGPGVPPSLISGQVAADELHRLLSIQEPVLA